MLIVKAAPRDLQRKRVYAAESQVKAFLRDLLPTIGEMQGFVDSILRNRWSQDYFGSRMLAPIAVRGGRRQRQRRALAHCFMSEISIPRGARSKFIVTHEVCHILTDRFHGQDRTAAHGPEFATFELMLVNHFVSEEDARDLLAAFARNGVAHSYREGQLP